jgi:hypothetical protein
MGTYDYTMYIVCQCEINEVYSNRQREMYVYMSNESKQCPKFAILRDS